LPSSFWNCFAASSADEISRAFALCCQAHRAPSLPNTLMKSFFLGRPANLYNLKPSALALRASVLGS
jgi:hypothetical protein